MNKINDHGGFTPSLVHPASIVSPSAVIGKGVYIQANACIWTRVEIGDFCIISPNVVIAHHSKIGKGCLISTLSGIGASVEIGERVSVGMGCTVVTGTLKIAGDSIIGAGAVVLEDIESPGLYVGVPARFLRSTEN